MKNDFIKWFKSSIFVEYLPMVLFVVIIFLFLVSESISNQNYHCPEYYDIKEEYADDVYRFVDNFQRKNPDMTEAEILSQRYILVESACGYPPIFLIDDMEPKTNGK